MQQENNRPMFNVFLFGLYLIFLVSIVFSLRAVSSISIGSILIIGLSQKKIPGNYFADSKWVFLFLLGCSLLFIIQCFSLLYTKHVSEGLKLLQRSSGMVAVPLAVLVSGNLLSAKKFSELAFYFGIILCIASFYCIGVAFFKFLTGNPYDVFFYHELVKPLSQHAIQFSILVYSSLVFLIQYHDEKKRGLFNLLRLPIVVFLSFVLILLSSKLIISFYILFLCFIFYKKQINKNRSRVFALCLIIFFIGMLLTPNPVSNRFRGAFTGNIMLFRQKEFDPGTYFNGVQFRLLQWRFTYEILNEQHAWISGLTPGDAQSFLDKKYIATKMYTGAPGTSKHGFLGYHTHNQFLQALLENGLPALTIFFLICLTLFKIAGHEKKLKWLVFLLIIYCFTDAPLATQYGLILFTFLPLLFYFTQKPAERKQLSTSYSTVTTKANYVLHDINQPEQPN